MFAPWLLLVALLAIPNPAFSGPSVLVVFDEDKDLPGLAAVNRGLRASLRSVFGDDLTFYSESLDFSQFRNPEYEGLLHEFLLLKYQGKRVDLIVAVMEPSLDFLLQQREKLFPGVPIVFCGVDATDIEGRDLPASVTGVMMKRNFAHTLEIALRLQPGVRQVFVVGGTSRFDQRILSIARRNFEPFENRVAITWLTNLPMDELLGQIANLPAKSLVVYLTVFSDGAGQPFTTHDVLRRVIAVSNAPVYVSLDQYIGSGAVGGSVYTVMTLGEEAGRMSARILRGESLEGIAPLSLDAYTPQFDWRAMQRWKLDESRLPAGSDVQFRTPTVWESYRRYIIGGIILFLLQTVLVVGLLVNRAARRRAELARRESEAHRRRAEEETLRQRDELAHALRVTTLGELAASFAHEVNQPLTAIVANAHAMREMVPVGRLAPDVDEALRDMVDDSLRAAEQIRRLQGLIRKRPAARNPLDINLLIEDVLHLLGNDIRQRQIVVKFSRTDGLPNVLGDSVQLRQVLINLLRNAEEAIALAGDHAREIHIETGLPDADHVAMTIRDTGSGVRESELERIFEHFVSSKPQGLGMGLAISRSIIESHEGRIWASRNEDRGLTLHIRIPVEPAART